MNGGWVLPAVSERERTLLATAELWGELGYERLTVEAICARAGIGVETFEAMFPDVEAAAQAAFEVPIGAVVGLVADQYAPDRSEPESCAMGIVAILRLMAANPAYAYITYFATRRGVPPAVHSVAKSGHRLVVAMLERLRESSGLNDQPVGAGVGALGAAEVMARREVMAGRTEQLPALAPDFVYAATVPFVGQRDALRLAQLVREPASKGRGRNPR
jgi:AcrR family transcriptional regulator